VICDGIRAAVRPADGGRAALVRVLALHHDAGVGGEVRYGVLVDGGFGELRLGRGVGGQRDELDARALRGRRRGWARDAVVRDVGVGDRPREVGDGDAVPEHVGQRVAGDGHVAGEVLLVGARLRAEVHGGAGDALSLARPRVADGAVGQREVGDLRATHAAARRVVDEHAVERGAGRVGQRDSDGRVLNGTARAGGRRRAGAGVASHGEATTRAGIVQHDAVGWPRTASRAGTDAPEGEAARADRRVGDVQGGACGRRVDRVRVGARAHDDRAAARGAEACAAGRVYVQASAAEIHCPARVGAERGFITLSTNVLTLTIVAVK